MTPPPSGNTKGSAQPGSGAPSPSPRRSATNVRRTEKISEVIAREIVKDSRGLPPGTMLPSEAKLLEQYQVGRASLREALRLLEVQGLILIRPGPGGGPMIAEVDSVHFSRMSSLYFHLAEATYGDALEARMILEPVVVGLLAEAQDPEDISVLQAYLDDARPTGADGEGNAPANEIPYVEKAFEFHAMLMGMARNPVIKLLARSLQDLAIDRWMATRSGAEHAHVFTEVHDEIARAIIEGRRGDAEQLMRHHMEEFLRFELAHDPIRLEQTVSWH